MAKFNEILKSKREELGLSTADISERTRLTERYIIALENRDIQSFEDDLSYLRYFVRAYCDAVNVPYDEVKEDVQEAVTAFAEEKEIALSKTHTDMESHIQQADTLTKVDKSKDFKQRNASKRRQRSYNRMDASFLSFIAIVIVILIIVAFAIFVFFQSADNNVTKEDPIDSTPPIQENQDIGNEEPTEEVREEMKIEKTGTTTYTVSNVYKDDTLTFTMTPGGSSAIMLSVDGTAVADEKIYYSNEPYVYELKVEKSCEVTIRDGFMYNNTIKINDQILEIDSSIAERSTVTYTIQIEMVE